MPPEDRMNRDEAVDLFWDQVVQGRDGETARRGLNPADIAAIQRFHAIDDRPAPSPAFARHLWEDLIQAPEIPVVPDWSRPAGANGYAGPVVLVPLTTPQ